MYKRRLPQSGNLVGQSSSNHRVRLYNKKVRSLIGVLRVVSPASYLEQSSGRHPPELERRTTQEQCSIIEHLLRTHLQKVFTSDHGDLRAG
jgi:hypothetical protein